MLHTVEELGTYLHLARASELRRRPLVRDRLLVIAGSIAACMRLASIAAYCRYKILQHNPQHMIGHWPAFQAALQDEDFHQFLRQQLRRFPREKAEQMLQSLGIEMARERQTYYTDQEYAAAILGTTPEELEALLGDAG